MAYQRILWVPGVLRAAGLNVVEHDGWRARGLSTARRFEPEYIVWHHDASSVGDSPGVAAYMIRNYDRAGAQLWVCAGCDGAHVSGSWHIIASGRAAHAGATRGDVENENSIGVETDHTTGEDWDSDLLASLRTGTAAMLAHMGKDSGALHFHKTICDPPGRKVDPDGLDLATERRNLEENDMTPEQINEAVWDADDTVKAPRHWPDSNKGTNAAAALAATLQLAIDARAEARANNAAITALAGALESLAPGIAEKVAAAVKETLAESVVDVNVNVRNNTNQE